LFPEAALASGLLPKQIPKRRPILLADHGGQFHKAGPKSPAKAEALKVNPLGDILSRLGLQVDRFADSAGLDH
jgi:hypothetical protein